jgi:mannose-1-phosphate guanylyltransferase
VILGSVQVFEHSYIDGSIIGWKSKIGKWSRLENLTLIGEDVQIADEIYLNGTIVLPNVSLKTSQNTPGHVVMA